MKSIESVMSPESDRRAVWAKKIGAHAGLLAVTLTLTTCGSETAYEAGGVAAMSLSSVDIDADTYTYIGTGRDSGTYGEIFEGYIDSYVYPIHITADSFPEEPEVEAVETEEPSENPPAEEPNEKSEEEKPEGEAPEEIDNHKAAEILSGSDHRYAKCGHIITAYMDDGYSYEQAIGVAANSAHESIGCNPEQDQIGGGPGKGIFQWETRFQGVRDLAKNRGESERSMDVQIDFSLWELDNTEGRAKRLLKETDTIEGATRVFCEAFERPGSPQMSKRHEAARVLHEEMERIKQG